MVTYFNRRDLVKFGEYLLSEERRKRFEESYKQSIRDGMDNPLPVEDRLKSVHHADIENWMHEMQKEKN